MTLKIKILIEIEDVNTAAVFLRDVQTVLRATKCAWIISDFDQKEFSAHPEQYGSPFMNLVFGQ